MLSEALDSDLTEAVKSALSQITHIRASPIAMKGAERHFIHVVHARKCVSKGLRRHYHGSLVRMRELENREYRKAQVRRKDRAH